MLSLLPDGTKQIENQRRGCDDQDRVQIDQHVLLLSVEFVATVLDDLRNDLVDRI